jgi:hypothetical protein
LRKDNTHFDGRVSGVHRGRPRGLPHPWRTDFDCDSRAVILRKRSRTRSARLPTKDLCNSPGADRMGGTDPVASPKKTVNVRLSPHFVVPTYSSNKFLPVVILSAATTPRSGVAAQSKDPLHPVHSNAPSGRFHRAPAAFDVDVARVGRTLPSTSSGQALSDAFDVDFDLDSAHVGTDAFARPLLILILPLTLTGKGTASSRAENTRPNQPGFSRCGPPSPPEMVPAPSVPTFRPPHFSERAASPSPRPKSCQDPKLDLFPLTP